MAVRGSIWRRVLIVVCGCALLGCWGGCSEQKRYRVLSFFFDGVPDPNAPVSGKGRSAIAGQQAVAASYSHKPYAEGKCEACHTGGLNSVFETASNLEVTAATCLKCHKQVPAEYRVMHGPVTAGECLRCHTPHESSSPALLASASPRVCLQCHVPEWLSVQVPEHLNPKLDCLECHSGHGGERHGLLRPRPTTAPTTAPATQAVALSHEGQQP